MKDIEIKELQKKNGKNDHKLYGEFCVYCCAVDKFGSTDYQPPKTSG
jgi:hypothetical protein